MHLKMKNYVKRAEEWVLIVRSYGIPTQIEWAEWSAVHCVVHCSVSTEQLMSDVTVLVTFLNLLK